MGYWVSTIFDWLRTIVGKKSAHFYQKQVGLCLFSVVFHSIIHFMAINFQSD